MFSWWKTLPKGFFEHKILCIILHLLTWCDECGRLQNKPNDDYCRRILWLRSLFVLGWSSLSLTIFESWPRPAWQQREKRAHWATQNGTVLRDIRRWWRRRAAGTARESKRIGVREGLETTRRLEWDWEKWTREWNKSTTALPILIMRTSNLMRALTPNRMRATEHHLSTNGTNSNILIFGSNRAPILNFFRES